ncbi:hypothetical protein QLQ11_18965 [Ochrobactrum sp. SSR]|nr:hypothetical protein QLQ11_18965 [Ochrobactrum sp. SSR]
MEGNTFSCARTGDENSIVALSKAPADRIFENTVSSFLEKARHE